MTARRNGANATRQLLSDGWEICATGPYECTGPEAVESAPRRWIRASVPGTAASALRAAGLWSLDDAERRFDAEDWWYRLRFDLPDEGLIGDSTLEFGGLATICEVWLNGQPLLSSESMYVSHKVATSNLRPGRNELYMAFRSLDAALKKRRPRPRWRAPMIENQQLRWHRTTVLGRTPGWSPPAAPVGPWKPVLLKVQPDCMRVCEVRTELRGTTGVVRFRGEVHSRNARLVTLELQRDGATVASTPVKQAGNAISAELHVEAVQCWFPHTHGQPALYEVLLSGTDALERPMTVAAGKVGFRRIEQRNSEPGAFGLKVNGVDVFCRGACWTPLDVVSLQAEEAALRRALEQVAVVGFNMLRISGAFVYEDDTFFTLCDELGILVWQEFMFANMDYPSQDDAFMNSVCQEATQQLQRWARHPSVAIICGNSEVSQQAAMWGAPRELWSPPLFTETLRQLTDEHCPHTSYWPSSATGGDFPHQVNSGTASYYGVGAYLRGLDDLRRSGVRFATECLGFANVPEAESLEALPGGSAVRVHHAIWKRRAPRDLGAGWDFDDVRDHYLRELFAVDPLQLRYADHARYLEISRRVPAELMASAFTEWRRADSMCSGALIWFLRDLWPGAGWGIVDASGEPKASYYALRQLLQPRWIGVTDEGLNGVVVHVGNETPQPLEAELELALFRDGQHLITRVRRNVSVGPRTTSAWTAASMLPEFHDLTHAYRFGPLSCDLIVATLFNTASELPLQAFHLPYTHLHATHDAGCVLKAQARKREVPGEYELTVHSPKFARSVHIDAPGYVTEMQYFHLAPGSERTVILCARAGSTQPLMGSANALNGRAVRIEVIG